LRKVFGEITRERMRIPKTQRLPGQALLLTTNKASVFQPYCRLIATTKLLSIEVHLAASLVKPLNTGEHRDACFIIRLRPKA
jgi:hypothetical protein